MVKELSSCHSIGARDQTSSRAIQRNVVHRSTVIDPCVIGPGTQQTEAPQQQRARKNQRGQQQESREHHRGAVAEIEETHAVEVGIEGDAFGAAGGTATGEHLHQIEHPESLGQAEQRLSRM